MAPHWTVHELEPANLPSGTEIGPWRVLELRGKGTYGAVYRVEPVGEERAGPFALKLALHPVDPRFEREVELLSRIHHSNVPRLRARGLWSHPAGPFPFLVMEWVHGVPLYDWAEAHNLSSRQVLRVLAQVARALEATHGVDGVHRDVKGANVLVRAEDGRAVLLDFGAGDFRGARTLTREVLPPGTPQYRSPEALRYQWLHWRQRGAHYEPGPADDVYALGVTAYRLVTGFYPPPGVDPQAAVNGAIVPGPALVAPEAVVTVCPELAGMIRQMLSEEPSARGRAAEVAQALEHAAETAGVEAELPITRRAAQASRVRTESRRMGRGRGPSLAVAVGVLACVSFYGWWTARRQPVEHPERGMEDAGTAGLAKDALTVSASVERPAPKPETITLEVPKEPLPGQRKPPCGKRTMAINGGCWVRPDDPALPCEEGAYEWKGACYYPVFAPRPPPTSESP
ncbi:serine/threonine protein kinase [Hyalangium rubrum]|uniref:non-specific serine/threonine protein kinase n=1 Tax=Hyalangium rubrum TaxID=3103134 RepID=A0ABU5H1D1_9BACT|nr:serine/threonine-protein kinase [Hyalangium sp. s54d21]MDY7226944.1 serine/threonine-protein kinase [Hyalangium sp. s54d21]